MKTKTLFFSSLVAAAAMSTVPAWAEEITLTNGEKTTLDASSGTTGSGNTYSYSTPTETDKGGWLWLGNLGATGNVAFGTSGSQTNLSGTGIIAVGYQGGNGGVTYNFDFSNTDASAFSGKFAVVNEWDNNTVVKLSGEGWSNVEYVSGGVSREQSWATLRSYDNADRAMDKLELQGATTLAGITGVSKGYSFSKVSDVNAKEFVTASTSGTVLTLAGTGTYSYYGSVGTSSVSIALEKTGTGTQTFGGAAKYLSSVNVSAGTLALTDGTVTISGDATVASGATLDLSGATVSLASAISNSGTVKVNSSNVFVLADALGSNNTYTLISGSGSITDWNSLTISNFRQADGSVFSGRSTANVATAGSVTITETTGNLVWNGGTTGTWDYSTDNTPWTLSGGTETTSFMIHDAVTFNTENATITVDSAGVTASAMTVSAATTLSGTGTVSVAAANLTTTNATLTLESGVTLDLGNLADNTNVVHTSLAGTGTVVIEKTGDGKNHNQTINLGTEFAGTVNYTGNLDPVNVTSFGSASASVNFTDVYFWSGNDQTGVIANSINFSGTGNKIQAQASATLNLTGPITFSSGASVTVASGTLNISGEVTGGNFTQTGGALNFSGTAEKTLGTISTSNGSADKSTLTIAKDTTVSATNFSNGWGLKTLTVNGTLNVSETFKYGTGSTTNAITGTGTISAKTFDFGNAGTYNVSGATLEVGSGGITHTNAWGYKLNLGATTIKATSDFTIAGNTGGIGTGSTSLTDTETGTTFDTNGHTITVNSAFGGSGKLVKVGDGTLSLAGTNTFSGGVTISAGKVVASNNSALGAAAGVEIAGGQLEIGSGITLAQTNITIALSDAYSETAAILGEGALAEGTTITLTKAEEAVIDSLVKQTKEYQIFASDTSLASSFTLESFSLDDEAWEGWKISNYDTSTGKVTLEMIPEPSAFGLLAGVGALVFVAARRRRRAK